MTSQPRQLDGTGGPPSKSLAALARAKSEATSMLVLREDVLWWRL